MILSDGNGLGGLGRFYETTASGAKLTEPEGEWQVSVCHPAIATIASGIARIPSALDHIYPRQSGCRSALQSNRFEIAATNGVL